MDLYHKKAIVTGISKGIGQALVRQLLDKGVTVAGWGIHEPGYTDPNLHFFHCDVRDMASVEAAFQNTTEVLGDEIHILVNNAGLGYFGYLEEMTPERFREIFDVNVFGIYHTCKYVIPLLKKYQYGHIINVASIAALEGMAQTAAYCGAKHAVRGITESLFSELRDFNVKVTGIYPGSTQTNFFDNSPNVKAHDRMMQPEEVAAQMVWALEASDNFVINSLEFRPLIVKPAR